MSEHDEAASVAASQMSSHARSTKDDVVKDGLTPDHLESLYTDLPEDATALKAIVGTMRIEISKKDKIIAKLKDEVDDVKASHSVVLQRSAEWQDELETLRLRVPQLEHDLRAEKQAKEAESDRVKDLRIRAEESRRAIMRLQGEQSDARAKAKVDNRRSWIPAPTNPPAVRDEQEEAELKKSKRASLAFGPNALNLNLASRPTSSQGPGHRRTASGGRSVSGASRGEADDAEEPLSPTMANGLRGLRLSGTAGMNGTSNSLLLPVASPAEDGGSAPNSRRSSFRSDAGKSPRLSLNELPPQDPNDLTSTLGARLSVPSAGPGAPRTSLLSSPALSQGAASSAGIGSPIIEDNEEDEAGPSAAVAAAAAGKALPTLPTRDSSIYDRELRAKEVEIERLSREMAEMRQTMDEALEARKASEACLKALRDFIATHDAEADANAQMGDDADRVVQHASFGAGLLKGVKLPPLPTDNIDDAEEAAHVKASSSPQKTATAGWSMKLPTLMRKATSSSTGATSASNGPTPSDEARSALPGGSEAETGSSSMQSSPQGPTAGAAAPPKSIASGFASFGNLLSRTGTTPNESAAASSSAPREDTFGSPQPMADEGAGSGFKGFGWFKRSSVVAGTSPAAQGETVVTVEEKVMSPPFRSLDHDQLSISRQSVISPLSESQAKQLANGSGAVGGQVVPGMRSSSSSGSALALAARIADEENAKKVAENIQRSEPDRSHRAQMAAEKTEQVEHLTDVVPAFD